MVTAEGEALLRKPIRELLDVLDPAMLQADPPLDHRQPQGRSPAIIRDDSGRGTVRLKSRPETLTVSAPFMALFRHM